MKKHIPYQHVSTALLAGAMLLPAFAAKEPTPAPDDLPVVVSLSTAEIYYPGSWRKRPDYGKTEIEFRVASKDDKWILTEPAGEDCRRRENEKAVPGSMRTYFRRNEKDNSLRLLCRQDAVPRHPQIVLQGAYALTRMKKGRALPPVTFELGTSGSFEAEGIPFEYESSQGGWEYLDNGSMSCWPASVTLKFPENAALASMEIRDEQGNVLDATPATRQAGKARFSFSDSGEKKRSVQVTATLAEAVEPFVLPLEQTVSLGSAVGLGNLTRAGVDDSKPVSPDGGKEMQQKRPASCPVTIRLSSIHIAADDSREYRNVGMRLKFNISLLDGSVLFVNTPRKGIVQGRDAAGNELQAAWRKPFFSEEEDGLSIYLYVKKLPKGEWLEFNSELPAYRARSSRSLPLQKIAFGKKGTFEVDGVRVDFEPCCSVWPGRKDRLGIAFSFENNGRIASIRFRDADGKPIDNPCSGSSFDQTRAIWEFSFPSSVKGPVQAIVTLREGIEPCIVPLNVRLGLQGIIEPDEKPAASRPNSHPQESEPTTK